MDNTTTAQERVADEAPGHRAVEMQAHRHVIDHLNAIGAGQAIDPELAGALGAQEPGIRFLERLGVDGISVGKFGVGT